ncbi:MAG: D-alanyl-D-alanine carboxypeptidase family protein [Oscillospiraceae bacterium]
MKTAVYKKIRGTTAVLLVLLCMFFAWPMSAKAAVYQDGLYQPETEPQAASAILVNENSGAVVYAKNADEQQQMASLVKMVTALVVMDNVKDLDAETVTAEGWVFDALYGLNASTADIRKGETLTVRELLYALLLPSANEAALMLAGYVSGGYTENFIYLMEQKVASLGCTSTVFGDPNGISENNLTTARDMALIVREFMKNPTLVEVAATSTYKMAAHNHAADYNIFSTNRLLLKTDPYSLKFKSVIGTVIAGKTGSLGEWQNFASQAVKDDILYTCVVLNSPNAADVVAQENKYQYSRPALYESAQLYDWAFTTLTIQPVIEEGKAVTEVKVKFSSDKDSVLLEAPEALTAVLPKDGSAVVEKQFDVPDAVDAPVKEGQVIGSVTFLVDGKEIGTAPLAATQSVSRNYILFIIYHIKNFASTAAFKWILLLLILAVTVYGLLVYRARKKYKKRQAAPKNSATASRPTQPPNAPLQNTRGEPSPRPPQKRR